MFAGQNFAGFLKLKNLNDNVSEMTQAPAQAGDQVQRPKLTLFGAFLRIFVAVAIVGLAGFGAYTLVNSRPEAVERAAFERSFTVAVVEPEFVSFTPTLRSFGEIQAANTLQVRAQASGEVQYVSENLRPGARVAENELLVQIDPFDYEIALSNAEVDVADARLSLTEIEEQQKLQTENVEFARQQYEVATLDLDRAQSLFDRGTITNQELESRKLVVSQREQTLRQAESSLVLQSAAIDRGQALIDRAERNVLQAQRSLAATNIVATFDGTVSTSPVTLGAIVSQGETLATLYESNNLELRFSMSEQNFGQIATQDVVGRPLSLTWDIADAPRTLSGEVVRIGAEVDPSLGGVELFARVDVDDENLVRPGTFVSVDLPGATLEDVLVLPETSLYESNHIYVLRDGKMARVDAVLLGRQDENVVISAQIDEAERIILTRLAQAGEGLRVNVEGEEAQRPGQGQGRRRGGGNGGAAQGGGIVGG